MTRVDSLGRRITPRHFKADARIAYNRPAPGDWTDRAACRGANWEWFFPPAGSRAPQAKQVCGGCLVRDECLTHAMTHAEWGVWGGKTEHERDEIRRRNRLMGGST
jgi:WhiB family transcriptional regulator, redox-sensing transcriptional regulator